MHPNYVAAILVVARFAGMWKFPISRIAWVANTLLAGAAAAAIGSHHSIKGHLHQVNWQKGFHERAGFLGHRRSLLLAI